MGGVWFGQRHHHMEVYGEKILRGEQGAKLLPKGVHETTPGLLKLKPGGEG